MIIKSRNNKRGQVISIVAFFVIVLSIFILGTLLMSFVNTILNPAEASFRNVSNESANAMTKVNDSFNKWWDYAIVFLFFLNVILLLISAYQVDTHPIFLVMYIIAVMLLVIFGGNVTGAISSLWDSSGVFGTGNPQGVNSMQYVPMTQFFLNNYTYIVLGIIVISGIVMYAKFKFGGNQGY
jgi:biotin transporter BioY